MRGVRARVTAGFEVRVYEAGIVGRRGHQRGGRDERRGRRGTRADDRRVHSRQSTDSHERRERQRTRVVAEREKRVYDALRGGRERVGGGVSLYGQGRKDGRG